MVELAEHAVIEVAQGGGVAVAAVAAGQVVSTGRPFAPGGHERPDESDGGEPVFFNVPVGDVDAAPGGFGDRRGPDERLQRSGVGESCAVITDFGEQTSTGEVGKPDERADNPVVGADLLKFLVKA